MVNSLAREVQSAFSVSGFSLTGASCDMGVFSGFKRFFFLFGFLAALGCGGPDSRAYQNRQPPFDPTVYFRSGRQGAFILWDRNGTIVETGQVSRTCNADQCKDTYEYAYTPGSEERPFTWRLHYTIEGNTQIDIRDDRFVSQGGVTGSFLELIGHEKVLRAPDKNVRSRTMINAIPGSNEPMVEVRRFSFFGLDAGSIMIRWQTGGR